MKSRNWGLYWSLRMEVNARHWSSETVKNCEKRKAKRILPFRCWMKRRLLQIATILPYYILSRKRFLVVVSFLMALCRMDVNDWLLNNQISSLRCGKNPLPSFWVLLHYFDGDMINYCDICDCSSSYYFLSVLRFGYDQKTVLNGRRQPKGERYLQT